MNKELQTLRGCQLRCQKTAIAMRIFEIRLSREIDFGTPKYPCSIGFKEHEPHRKTKHRQNGIEMRECIRRREPLPKYCDCIPGLLNNFFVDYTKQINQMYQHRKFAELIKPLM